MASKVCSSPFILSSSVALPKPPSNYCHICARPAKAVGPLTPCANIASGTCRKVICMSCSEKNNLPTPSPADLCCHCVGTCPLSAQCKLYEKSNNRRRQRIDVIRASRKTLQKPRTSSSGAKSTAERMLSGCCGPRHIAKRRVWANKATERGASEVVTPETEDAPLYLDGFLDTLLKPPTETVPLYPDGFLDAFLGEDEPQVVDGLRCSTVREADAVEDALRALKTQATWPPTNAT